MALGDYYACGDRLMMMCGENGAQDPSMPARPAQHQAACASLKRITVAREVFSARATAATSSPSASLLLHLPPARRSGHEVCQILCHQFWPVPDLPVYAQ